MNISKFTHYDYKESGRNIDQLFKFYRCISLDLPHTVHSEWSKTIPGIGSLEWVWYSLPPASVICRKVMFSVVSISVHGRVIPMRFRPFQTCSLKNTSPPPASRSRDPTPTPRWPAQTCSPGDSSCTLSRDLLPSGQLAFDLKAFLFTLE